MSSEWIPEPGRVPVLVVEDDPADALVLERILAGSVYQPLLVRTVREARSALDLAQPAAILLDIVLLGDESWRLLLEVRTNEAHADIPVVVTSATDEARKAGHLGADDYIAKPIDREALIDTLDRLTGRRSLTQVLVVDDEKVTQYLVRQLLPRTRYRLWTANDGTEALACLAEHKPDVVLLDLRMPGMDGFELLGHLQRDTALARLPVIVLTSAVLEPEERALLDHASRVMSKSDLAAGTLIDTINGVLQVDENVGAT
jgi:CheY-like chemotaxis protein